MRDSEESGIRNQESKCANHPNTTFGSLLIANPVSSSPTGMFVRATYTENGNGPPRSCASHKQKTHPPLKKRLYTPFFRPLENPVVYICGS